VSAAGDNHGDAPDPERICRGPRPLLIDAADNLAILEGALIFEVRVDRRRLELGGAERESHG
jgi:hypothetical protein